MAEWDRYCLANGVVLCKQMIAFVQRYPVWCKTFTCLGTPFFRGLATDHIKLLKGILSKKTQYE